MTERGSGPRFVALLSAGLWFAQLPALGCSTHPPGADLPVETADSQDDTRAPLDASGPPPRAAALRDAGRPPHTTPEAGPASLETSAARPPTAGDREPCCAIDGGARPPTELLEGCTSALVGELGPPPPDVCAQNGNFEPSSLSQPLARKLVAGRSYRFSYAQLQVVSGGPVVVDVFGAELPCVRTELLFTLRLDGRAYQEYCFIPQRDVLYSVTRVEVGGVAFAVDLSDTLVDLCAEACTP